MTTNVSKQERTVKRIPAKLNPRPPREDSVASFADVIAMSRRAPDGPREVNPRPCGEESSAACFADVYMLSRSEHSESDWEVEEQESLRRTLDATTRLGRRQPSPEKEVARFRADLKRAREEHETEERQSAPAECNTVDSEDEDWDDAEFNFLDDIIDYEQGWKSRIWMQQVWGERFAEYEAEHEASAAKSSNDDPPEQATPPVPECSADAETHPEPSSSPSIGTPSLLRWTKRRGMVAVPADFARITKNAEQAIILAQLCYWFDLT